MRGGFKPRACRIINELQGQASPRGSQGVLDSTDPFPLFLPHLILLSGPTCRPPVGMETGPYLAAGLVHVRGGLFVLV